MYSDGEGGREGGEEMTLGQREYKGRMYNDGEGGREEGREGEEKTMGQRKYIGGGIQRL